jgi:endonuclease YncB( thermonuclease family)
VRLPRISHLRELPGWAFIVGSAVGITIAVAIPYLIAAKDARRPPIADVPISLTLPAGTALTSLQEVPVTNVFDGDTIEVLINGRKTRIRYYGVDTPERGDRCFREATDRNKILAGKSVFLLPDARDQDQYGRTLRYVFRADGVSLDATLVAEGFGHAWRSDGQYKSQIIDLEDQARTADRGCLWGS